MPYTPEPPYGVWRSEEPNITLFFRPEYRNVPTQFDNFSYLGLYVVGDEELRVFVTFGNGPRFRIQEFKYSNKGDNISIFPLFIGNWRVVGDQIHYTLTPHFQEQLGITTIIFHRLEYYDPIDPYYWFPHFFPRSEEITP